MRTLIEIPDDHIKALDRLKDRNSVSRSEIIRKAIAEYLEKAHLDQAEISGDIFGLTKDDPGSFDGLDGLEYQQKIRSEWDHRESYMRWGMHDVRAQDDYESK